MTPSPPAEGPSALRTLLPLGIAALAIVLTVLTWPRDEPTPPRPVPATPTSPAPTAPPAPTPAVAPIAAEALPPDTKPLRYPDGSEYPPLNGVKAPAPITWPPKFPFSPVVGRVVDKDGIEWYRHADGALSTTRMMFRKDLGRDDALTVVCNPTDPQPVIDETQTRALPQAAGRK